MNNPASSPLETLMACISVIRRCSRRRVSGPMTTGCYALSSASNHCHTSILQRIRQHIIIGDDFRFGHKRAGDRALLERIGAQEGFTVTEHATVTDQESRISSTRIRQALLDGKLDEAESLLGRPYRISGRVIHGEKVGRVGFSQLQRTTQIRHNVGPLSPIWVSDRPSVVENSCLKSTCLMPTKRCTENSLPSISTISFEARCVLIHSMN